MSGSRSAQTTLPWRQVNMILAGVTRNPKTQTAPLARGRFLLRSLGKGKLFVIRFQVEEDTVLFVTDHRVKVASGIGAF